MDQPNTPSDGSNGLPSQPSPPLPPYPSADPMPPPQPILTETPAPSQYPTYQPPVQNPVQAPESPPIPPPEFPGAVPTRRSPLSVLVTVGMVVVLFGLGVLGSMALRQYLNRTEDSSTSRPMPSPVAETRDEEVDAPIIPSDATDSGMVESRDGATNDSPSDYVARILSGVTGEALDGVSFRLPAGVKPLECDRPNCISQGTFLPGGTRFTVAARGRGEKLRDFRDGVISDAFGKEFTVEDITYQGRKAVQYSADFSGSTVNNFGFSRMSGIMIALTDDSSIEFNHFTPAGKQTDFPADEELFEQILVSLSFDNPFEISVGSESSSSGAVCGGIAGTLCPKGYECQSDGDYPDASGTCVAE